MNYRCVDRGSVFAAAAVSGRGNGAAASSCHSTTCVTRLHGNVRQLPTCQLFFPNIANLFLKTSSNPFKQIWPRSGFSSAVFHPCHKSRDLTGMARNPDGTAGTSPGKLQLHCLASHFHRMGILGLQFAVETPMY